MSLASIFVLMVTLSILPTFADEQVSNTELTKINEMIGIEKTTIQMNIPVENTLPWGFVEGKIANHVSDYPVIMQIYKDDEAYHFAQTNVNDDGSYEYKFRVLDINTERTINVFQGDYTVKIFKVVYLNPDLSLI